jgi:hypothetical protein
VNLPLFLFLTQSITTANYDLNRTNYQPNEDQLTPAAASGSLISSIGSYSVDGYVFAQPLYVPGVVISGQTRNLLIVVTMNDSIYAFDADQPGKTVWSNTEFDSPYPDYPVAEASLYGQSLGCLSTPVVDVANSEIWAVCDSDTGPAWILRSFSLTTGAVLTSTTIAGEYPGTGDVGSSPTDPTSGDNLLFFPKYEFQRAALTLANGNIYIGFGGLDDTQPWHGWLFAYSESSQSQVGVFCTSPNGYGAAIWMSGGGPAVDASGNLYVSTGNGGGASSGLYTNSVLAFSSSLSLLGSWTTSRNSSDNSVDADVAANRVILLPGGNSLASIAGKDLYADILSTSCLVAGGSGTSCQEQEWQTEDDEASSQSGSYGAALIGTTLYLPITNGHLYAYTCAGTGSSTCVTTPAAGETRASYGIPGAAQIAGSCNGGINCVLWLLTVNSSTHSSVQAGTLRAWSTSTLDELWNDGGSTLGNMTKFAAPVIANGKVFVATQSGKIEVYAAAQTSPLPGVKMGGKIR